jgi:hypothetical protein
MTDLEAWSHGPDEVTSPEQAVELELDPPQPLDPGPTPIRRPGAGIVAAVVFIPAAAFAWGLFMTGTQPASRVDVQPPSWLLEKARSAASGSADPTSVSAGWVLTDARTAAPAVGLQDADAQAMRYVLVLQGSFNIGQRAFGTAPITGSVLVISYDADTHEVTDWGVDDRPVDLPGLQPVSL